jgi:squalene cyclase
MDHEVPPLFADARPRDLTAAFEWVQAADNDAHAGVPAAHRMHGELVWSGCGSLQALNKYVEYRDRSQRPRYFVRASCDALMA